MPVFVLLYISFFFSPTFYYSNYQPYLLISCARLMPLSTPRLLLLPCLLMRLGIPPLRRRRPPSPPPLPRIAGGADDPAAPGAPGAAAYRRWLSSSLPPPSSELAESEKWPPLSTATLVLEGKGAAAARDLPAISICRPVHAQFCICIVEKKKCTTIHT